MDDNNENAKRYHKAAHAMQAGVALEMSYDSGPTEPKHLRVGINAAMADIASLAGLLIEKGIFTEEEYIKALADGMEKEKERYELHLRERFPNTKITLV